ncbi:TrbM/KikA/MpfK family conjugal transfer protein [Neisseria sp. CCUG12390]|uniref:TrbM/KikA/MpfK family conjugal transfer protein n=1 Tax=Neisseria sp. CCUG12390 TaxID=3392035 RepID=UPI003A0FC8F8
MKLIPVYTLILSLLPLTAFAAPGSNQSPVAPDLLTGDTRLACEATLCLSSGERPSECNPSLRRFFSIKHKKWGDTLKARKDFLKLCPSSKENDGMRRLVDAIAEGAGRCDAKELNRVMRYTVNVRECPRYRIRDRDSCPIVKKTYIRNGKPSYCSVYFDHEWTVVGDSVKYVGDEKKGGRWVDVK